jgi:hypothetical protein
MASVESRYVIERLSATGLIWLRRMGVHGAVWTADKSRAHRFFRLDEAAQTLDAMPGSLSGQIRLAFVEDMKRNSR